MRNPFDTPLAARSYAEGRPYYHEVVVRHLSERPGLLWPVPLALDVGCGTGQSSRPLLTLARTVFAIDASRHMLAHAERTAGVVYALAAAEALPVKSRTVSLLTCGAAFHWLGRDAFLREVRRVLRPDGVAAIYDNFFAAVSRESGEFASWYQRAFLDRFPKPPRHPRFRPGPAEEAGLRTGGPKSYRNDVSMGVEDLVNYLITQSNVQAALAVDPRALPHIQAWLRAEVRPFFVERERSAFEFGGEIWYLTTA